ncbi:MAG TPA: hypothetical protein VK250_06040 [Nitrososphaeraceae archaeon]|nr:hypothetical protein [Nitrososphaeraceae archaeon]
MSEDLMLICKNSNVTFSIHDSHIEVLEYDFKDGNKWKPLQKHPIDKYVEIEDNKYNVFSYFLQVFITRIVRVFLKIIIEII